MVSRRMTRGRLRLTKPKQIRGFVKKTFKYTAAFAIAVIGGLSFAMRPPDYDALQSKGDRFVLQLEDYRATHGEYPVDAVSAGVERRDTPWGRWIYEKRPDGSFQLGLTTKFPGRKVTLRFWWFSLCWQSNRNNWRVSTDSC